ncbi:MAG: hypothetical protein ABEH56_07375 [Salinirussus sp.]
MSPRAQSSLPALAVALLALTAATVVGVSVAGGALVGTDRAALDRQAAVALSERLTAADAPLTARASVLNGSRLDRLSAATIRARYGLGEDASVRLRLDGRRLVRDGRTDGGVTVRRLVLVERRVERTLVPAFESGTTVTLPRRTDGISLDIDPPANTTVRSVRADGRVVLRNGSGLVGSFDVRVSPYETIRLRFGSAGPLERGNVTIRYDATRTRKARLAVTVDG